MWRRRVASRAEPGLAGRSRWPWLGHRGDLWVVAPLSPPVGVPLALLLRSSGLVFVSAAGGQHRLSFHPCALLSAAGILLPSPWHPQDFCHPVVSVASGSLKVEVAEVLERCHIFEHRSLVGAFWWFSSRRPGSGAEGCGETIQHSGFLADGKP